MRTARSKRVPVCIGLFPVVIAGFFYFIYRPWQLTWGASEEEVARAMVGDALVQDPTFNATRAVTIHASPEDIWPWIVQIGYRRAGFYSYDFLDNDGLLSANRIIPRYQNLKVGDRIPMAKGTSATVAELERGKHMLMVFEWGGKTATWAWGLYKADERHTRLVTRLRVRHENLLSRLLIDAGELVMMRKCMLGIKQRAESSGQRPPDAVQP